MYDWRKNPDRFILQWPRPRLSYEMRRQDSTTEVTAIIIAAFRESRMDATAYWRSQPNLSPTGIDWRRKLNPDSDA